jgi:hypothetical protein
VDSLYSVFGKSFEFFWKSTKPIDQSHMLLLAGLGFLIFLFFISSILNSLKSILEIVSKYYTQIENFGFFRFFNMEMRHKIRRRSLFCEVLSFDLASLAKTENWNDQYFTDLEAEVESEGEYYASALDRWLKKKSTGLRKETSLINAITNSTERAVQLLGEPGAGKSVALRHLAHQLAEKGKKSKAKKITIPLYINLRELEILDNRTVNSDLIQQFILENIRHGDSDTTAYIKENWNEYREEGLWIFLFDSFDEIPAILHAEIESKGIKIYSEAIRQFLEGMGNCRGVIASRSFKGPENLPWTKFKILPLSGIKQDELINRASLSNDQVHMVRQHLAESDSSIGTTPLFLTLLCKFVKSQNCTPLTDYNLLSKHIEHLANRDAEYIGRKYSIQPKQLLEEAEKIAVLFAMDPSLSLAPSLSQISSSLNSTGMEIENLSQKLAALVDAKIGRTDLAQHTLGERRFTFSHRRYQETLFVNFLVKNKNSILPLDLLTNSRWREYAVTLLQTHSNIDILPILDVAENLLQEELKSSSEITVLNPLDSNLSYFDWENNSLMTLLSILQEGLSRRIADVPNSLNTVIQNVLIPRWNSGDAYDHCQVILNGGLLPQESLIQIMAYIFDYGSDREKTYAFQQSSFLHEMPIEISEAVLKRLADSLLYTQNRKEILQLEVLMSRLPENIGKYYVYKRCMRLRTFSLLFERISKILFPYELVYKILNFDYKKRNRFIHDNTIVLQFFFVCFIYFVTSFVFETFHVIYLRPLLVSLIFLLLILCIIHSVILTFKHQGEALTFKFFISRFSIQKTLRVIVTTSKGLFFGCLFPIVGYALGKTLNYLFHYLGIKIVLNEFLAGVVVVYFFIGFIFLSRKLTNLTANIKYKNRYKTLRNLNPSDIELFLSAESLDEAKNWLINYKDFLISNSEVRSVSRLICTVFEPETKVFLPQILQKNVSYLVCKNINDLLFLRLLM